MADNRRIGAGGVLLTVSGAVLIVLLGVHYRDPLWASMSRFFDFLLDRDKTTAYITHYGAGAPLVFMLVQILQVVLAPVPGEATGFIGGYAFGVFPGFVFSSIALTIGSCINFAIGRLLGHRFVRKWIPGDSLKKFDRIARRQGALLVFVLFVIPGFPKDYLCLFLGLSKLPFKAFVFLTGVGRMPGTFLLSLQGAMLFEKNYSLLATAIGVCCLFVVFAYRYRERLYQWVEKQTPAAPTG